MNDLDAKVVAELRTRAAAGESATSLATWLVQSVGTSMNTAVAYFREAFLISRGAATAITSAPIFGGLLRREARVDAVLAKSIASARSKWIKAISAAT